MNVAIMSNPPSGHIFTRRQLQIAIGDAMWRARTQDMMLRFHYVYGREPQLGEEMAIEDAVETHVHKVYDMTTEELVDTGMKIQSDSCMSYCLGMFEVKRLQESVRRNPVMAMHMRNYIRELGDMGFPVPQKVADAAMARVLFVDGKVPEMKLAMQEEPKAAMDIIDSRKR